MLRLFDKRKNLNEQIFLLEKRVDALERKIKKISSENSATQNDSSAIQNENNEYEKISSPVVMGQMNKNNDKYPTTIIAACYYLNKPLPRTAKCSHQPSFYLGKDVWENSFDTFVDLMKEKLPDMQQEEMKKEWNIFIRRYKGQECLEFTTTDLFVYFCDWILFAKCRGFSYHDYFDYELYNKEPDIRDTFLNEGYRVRVYECCNKVGVRKVLANKAKFNKKFKKWIKRDWIDASVCTFEEFQTFIKKHENFFAKPVRGTGGVGARVICRESQPASELFLICQEEKLILEEIIQQHPSLSEFNESTLNTVRVNTLLCADGVVRVTLALARFGCEGNAVDNFHGGGVGAIIDIDTGVITSEAINRAHIRSTVHPDSGKRITGFVYPHWEDIKQAVCQAAQKIPSLRHVGWDVSVTKNGNVEFVEGNSRPNFDVLQSPDQIGRRFRYIPYINEIEQLENILYTELDPLNIDISEMEKIV